MSQHTLSDFNTSSTLLKKHKGSPHKELTDESSYTREEIALLEYAERKRRDSDDLGEGVKKKLAVKVSLLVRAHFKKTEPKNGALDLIGTGLYWVGFVVSLVLRGPAQAAKQLSRFFYFTRAKVHHLAWAGKKTAPSFYYSLGYSKPTLPWSEVEKLENAERFGRIAHDRENPARILMACEISLLITGLKGFDLDNLASKKHLTKMLEEAERQRRIAEIKIDSDKTSKQNAVAEASVISTHYLRTLHKSLQSNNAAKPDLEEVVIRGPLMSRNSSSRETVRLYREMAVPTVGQAPQMARMVTCQAPVAVVVPLIRALEVANGGKLAENLAQQGTVVIGKAAM